MPGPAVNEIPSVPRRRWKTSFRPPHGKVHSAMAAADTNALLTRAVNLLHAGEIHHAQQLCRQVHAANRKDHRATAILGQIATMQGRHQEAVNLLKQCVRLAPAEIDYHVLLAESLASQGRYREALGRYDKA